MRRVKYNRFVNKETEVGEAFFHCFGMDYEEFEEGPGNFSVAILELASGEVITAMADDITFLDKPVIIPLLPIDNDFEVVDDSEAD